MDLTFTSQPDLVMESGAGVHSSLHQKCHHQMIYSKINLNIHYPPPYGREIWHYKYANSDLIQRVIYYYSWERSEAEKNVNEKVHIFSKTIKNIFSNFIPHEKIISDHRDPPWISNKIKKLINAKILHTKAIFKMVKVMISSFSSLSEYVIICN